MKAPSPEKRRAERYAILSSCCGFTGEAALTDSAIILLFAGMVGAGEMLTLITTAVFPLLNGCMLIPMAFAAMRIGARKLVLTTCAAASIFYFCAVCAPFAGKFRVEMLIGSISLFALSLTGFVAGWFPMLDTFLDPERRTAFFGRMRFFHQLSATLFLIVTGMLIGKTPSLPTLQLVLLVAGILFTGRFFAIARIPRFPHDLPAGNFSAGLRKAVENRNLTGFSLYVFLLNLASFGTVPVVLLYLQKEGNVPGDTVVTISGVALGGMAAGYTLTGRIIRRIGIGQLIRLLHGLFLSVNAALAFLSGGSAASLTVITGLLFLSLFGVASLSIATSTEMMRLAQPGNKVMAMALSGSFVCGGAGLARLLSSFLLGSGILAERWTLFGNTIDRYHSLLLLYAGGILLAALFLPLLPPEEAAEKHKSA